MKKDQEREILDENFNRELLEIYNMIFNYKADSYKEYNNSIIELNECSYNL